MRGACVQAVLPTRDRGPGLVMRLAAQASPSPPLLAQFCPIPSNLACFFRTVDGSPRVRLTYRGKFPVPRKLNVLLSNFSRCVPDCWEVPASRDRGKGFIR